MYRNIPASHETDTFEVLKEQVNGLGNLNREILETIESRKNENVITGYKYFLEYTYTEGSQKDGEKPSWTFKQKPLLNSVLDDFESWTYRGEPLDEEKIIQRYDMTLETYEDVVRLIPALQELGETYSTMMIDRPETRTGLRIILTNMERIQVALGELYGKTVDFEESAGRNKKLQDGMEKIVDGINLVSQVLPTVTLNVNATYREGASGKIVNQRRHVSTGSRKTKATRSRRTMSFAAQTKSQRIRLEKARSNRWDRIQALRRLESQPYL